MNFCINEDNSMEIDEFEVLLSYRGKGIGEKLF